MRAAVFTERGPAEVLQIVEREMPPVGPGEVRVRIVLSAVNPTDTGTRAGRGVPDGVAVGNAAIQLAKWAGATVLTTVSSKEKGSLAAAAGADAVINYREEDVAARVRELAPGGAQVIVEVNTANLELDLEVAAPGGNVAIYVGGKFTVPSFKAMLKNLSFDFVLTYTTSAQEKDAAVAAVAEAVNAGAFQVGEQAGLPIVRFGFERAGDAHTAVEEHVTGKVVIEVSAG